LPLDYGMAHPAVCSE